MITETALTPPVGQIAHSEQGAVITSLTSAPHSIPISLNVTWFPGTMIADFFNQIRYVDAWDVAESLYDTSDISHCLVLWQLSEMYPTS